MNHDSRDVAALSRILGAARREPILFAALAFLAVLNITAIWMLNGNANRVETLTRDNRTIISQQLPVLRARVAERDKTIAEHEAVLSQAIDAIQRLSLQVDELGGDPGQIILRPPGRPPPDDAHDRTIILNPDSEEEP